MPIETMTRFRRAADLAADGWRAYQRVAFDVAGRQLAAARDEAEPLVALPGGAELYADASLRLGVVLSHLQRDDDARAAIAVALALDPDRPVTLAEFSPDAVALVDAVRIAPPQHRTVRIAAAPAGAVVTVDGRELGPAPIDAELGLGRHVVVARAPLYAPRAVGVAVAADTESVRVELERDVDAERVATGGDAATTDDAAQGLVAAVLRYTAVDEVVVAAAVERRGAPALLAQRCGVAGCTAGRRRRVFHRLGFATDRAARGRAGRVGRAARGAAARCRRRVRPARDRRAGARLPVVPQPVRARRRRRGDRDRCGHGDRHRDVGPATADGDGRPRQLRQVMIIDSHAHFEPRMLDLDAMIGKLDAAGVAKVALIPAMNDPLPDTPKRLLAAMRALMQSRWTRPVAEAAHRLTLTRDGNLRLGRQVVAIYARPDNAAVAAALARYPERLLGWVFLNPSLPGALDELERWRAVRGMIGIKLHPHWHDYHADVLDPVLARAQELKLPALIHLGFGRRGDYRAIATKFPRLVVIAAHAGFPFYADLWAHARDCPNLHVDLSSPYIDERLARAAVAALGPERCLYGTDSPYGFHEGDGSYDYREIRRWVERMPVSEVGRDRIFADNFRGLLDAAGVAV